MKTMKILNKHNLLDEFVDHYSNMQTDNPEASNEWEYFMINSNYFDHFTINRNNLQSSWKLYYWSGPSSCRIAILDVSFMPAGEVFAFISLSAFYARPSLPIITLIYLG